MSYSGKCFCGKVSFSFPYDPMLHFSCHCANCKILFGSTLEALVIGDSELEIKGETRSFTYEGGSGMKLHNHRCLECGTVIYNNPELLEGVIYLPAGLLAGQIQFKPKMEIWSLNKPSSLATPASVVESFEDNGTVERITELLENLDQRQ